MKIAQLAVTYLDGTTDLDSDVEITQNDPAGIGVRLRKAGNGGDLSRFIPWSSVKNIEVIEYPA